MVWLQERTCQRSKQASDGAYTMSTNGEISEAKARKWKRELIVGNYLKLLPQRASNSGQTFNARRDPTRGAWEFPFFRGGGGHVCHYLVLSNHISFFQVVRDRLSTTPKLQTSVHWSRIHWSRSICSLFRKNYLFLENPRLSWVSAIIKINLSNLLFIVSSIILHPQFLDNLFSKKTPK